ncbi:hypothetical protein IRZ53_01800 [Pseudomonas fulva]|uniref:I78 family peptidase inhibitor n=1 Tax=Pseudomonas fulva TaxID=47880 RepID=UPI0018A9E150|nr:I78 family peptidase inhibitor [Pseudomonas fulva]MBF8673083.1 hypothetical protein [Pseudomonas fulva]MBF8695526.1 hypothetical protein [Pseudomonas fulva]
MTNEEVLQTLAHLVGTAYEPAIKQTICTLTGRTRVLGPHDISTFEYDANRIHIKVDAEARIKGFSFA